eukprot:TRINITY_DN4976_c0_g3_i1.p1 TRINITY_DN4976_c0_g3~~TRINITY_DN4976_c0_g3_i1.p1  ORF type:complete len:2745 (+),score=778.15 TRINITY_DN4976_c0_g3_i1:71-8236(+)
MSLARMTGLTELLRAHRRTVIGTTRQDELPDGAEYNCVEKSCACWDAGGDFRRHCIQIIDNVWFERVILLSIGLNCITLAMDDPSYSSQEVVKDLLGVSSWVFLGIFTVECGLKIVAMGFVMHRGSYLRSSWNIIDFTAVMVGLTQAVGISAFKLTVLRALRILRPLRMVSRLKELRLLIQTLATSLPLIADVFLLLGFLVCIFAILGTQIWAGALHHKCYIPRGTTIDRDTLESMSTVERATVLPFLDSKQSTLVRDFLVQNDSEVCGTGRPCESNGVALPMNCTVHTDLSEHGLGTFDNTWQGILLVLKVSSLDDWPQDMHNFQQRSGHVAWVFFGFLTLLGNYFVFNLVLAVLSAAFSASRARINPDKPPLMPWLRCHHAIGGAAALCLEAVACGGLSTLNTGACQISLKPSGRWVGYTWEPDPSEAMVFVAEDLNEKDDEEEDADDEDEDEETEEGDQPADGAGEGGEVAVVSEHASSEAARKADEHGRLWELEGRQRRWAHRVHQLTVAWDRNLHASCDYVCVFVERGTGLIKVDKRDSDPYCVVSVELNGMVAGTDRTEHRSGTRNPVWNHNVFFMAPGSISADGSINLKVTIHVADHDTDSKDDFMGYCEHRTKLVMSAGGRIELDSITMPLGPRPGNTTDNAQSIQLHRAGQTWGSVTFSITVNDQLDEPGQQAADADTADAVALLAESASDISTDDSSDQAAVADAAQIVAHTEEDRLRKIALLERRDKIRFMRVAGLSRETIRHVKTLPEWHSDLWYLSHGYLFVSFFILVTMINVAALSVDHYPASDNLLMVINEINFWCTICFMVEAAVKIFIMRHFYFKDGYNLFDLTLVLFSVPDLFASSNSSQFTVLRVLRLLRAFKLLQRFPSLRQVIGTVVESVSQVFWLWCLIMLFIFIFAVLGMHLFGQGFESDPDEWENFSKPEPYNRIITNASFASFWQSLLAVFVITTGESWGSLMWMTMENAGWFSCFYFVAAFLLGNCIFLNLFVAILVDNCDRADEKEQKEELKEAELTGNTNVAQDHQRAMELDRMQMEMMGNVGKVCGEDEQDLLCLANVRREREGGFFAKREAITASKRKQATTEQKKIFRLWPAGSKLRHPRRGVGVVVEAAVLGQDDERRWKMQFDTDAGTTSTHFYRQSQMEKLQLLSLPEDVPADVTGRRQSSIADIPQDSNATSATSEECSPLLPESGYQPSAVGRTLGGVRRVLGSPKGDALAQELLAGVPSRSREHYALSLEDVSAEVVKAALQGDLRRMVTARVPLQSLSAGNLVLEEDFRHGLKVVDVVRGEISAADAIARGMLMRTVAGRPVLTIDDFEDTVAEIAEEHKAEEKRREAEGGVFTCRPKHAFSDRLVEIVMEEPSTVELHKHSQRMWGERLNRYVDTFEELRELTKQATILKAFHNLGYGQGSLRRALGVGDAQVMSQSGQEFFSRTCYKDWRARLKTARFGHKKSVDFVGRLVHKIWDVLREEAPAARWEEHAGIVPPGINTDEGGIPAGDLEECRRWCQDRGHGGFVVVAGQAYTIPWSTWRLRRFVQSQEPTDQPVSVHLPAPDPVLQEPSLGLFPEESPVRQTLSRIVRTESFDAFVTVLIFLNMIFIAIDNPEMEDSQPEIHQAIQTTDIVFAVLFVLECTAKIIVHGFWKGEYAYCNDKWNVVDLVVAVTAFIGIFVRTVRFFRALRTIRLIVRILEVRLMVEWLFLTLPRVASTVQLLFFFILTWAILGVQFFKGAYGQCNNNLVHEEQNCTGEFVFNESTAFGTREVVKTMQWETFDNDFDNTLTAMFSLFIMAIGDDWASLMYAGMDATASNPKVGHRTGPSYNNRPYMSLYFVIFVVVGQFFLMNLFVGVLINTFVKTKERETGQAELSNAQVAWIQAQRLLLQTPLEPIIPTPPDTGRTRFVRQICYRVALSDALERFMTVAILLNAALMATGHYNEPSLLAEFGKDSNVCFVVIFALEALVKIIGMTPRYYFRDNWNRFDFVVVALSLVGTLSGSGGQMSVLRLFRVLRLVRLLNKTRGLRTLVNAVMHSLPHLWNVSLLLLVVFFMFGIAGVQLFGRVNTKSGAGLTDHANFKNIYYALVTLYQIASTEGWVQIMFGTMVQEPDCNASLVPHSDCGAPEWISRTFFVLFMVVGSALILNLFVTVVVDRYNDASEAAQHSDRLSALDGFVQKWRQYDPTASGMIDATAAIGILETLSPDLWDSHQELVDAGRTSKFIVTLRNLEKMCIPVGVTKDRAHRLHVVRFNDVVSCLAARIYNLTSPSTIELYQWRVDQDPTLLNKLGRGFNELNPLDRRVVHPLCAAFAVQKLSPWQLRGPGRYYELHHLHAVNVVVRRMKLLVSIKHQRMFQQQLYVHTRQTEIMVNQLAMTADAYQSDNLMLERSVRVLDSFARARSVVGGCAPRVGTGGRQAGDVSCPPTPRATPNTQPSGLGLAVQLARMYPDASVDQIGNALNQSDMQEGEMDRAGSFSGHDLPFHFGFSGRDSTPRHKPSAVSGSAPVSPDMPPVTVHRSAGDSPHGPMELAGDGATPDHVYDEYGEHTLTPPQTWSEGDRVEVWYPAHDLGTVYGNWFPAQIVGHGRRAYDVVFDSGEKAEGILTDFIRTRSGPSPSSSAAEAAGAGPPPAATSPASLVKGDQVLVWRHGSVWHKGVVADITADGCLVQFEDGTSLVRPAHVRLANQGDTAERSRRQAVSAATGSHQPSAGAAAGHQEH